MGSRRRCSVVVATVATGVLLALAPAAVALTLSPAPGSPYATSYGEPVSATVGDFNGDGLPDFALGTNAFSPSHTPGSEAVSLFLADGTGGFRRAATGIGLGEGSPVSVVAADFNGDGRSDLAAANAGAVSVFLSNGAGTPEAAPGSPIPAAQAFAVVTGDFNGDGRADLAVLKADDTVLVLLGNGRGGFSTGPGSPVALGGEAPDSIVAGDFNGDGRTDVAVSDYSRGTETVLLGNGNGTLTPAKSSPFPVGAMPGAAAVGDFTGDGRQDLAVATSTGVSVFLGHGDGTFTSAPGSPIVTAGRSPTGLAAGDFNGDGRLDLAVGNRGFGSGPDLLLGDGTGEFRSAPGSPLTLGSPEVLAGGRFDGRASLIVSPAGTLAGTVSVLLAPAPSDPPTATLAVAPNPVLPGAPVRFDGSASSDPLDRAIVDYQWDTGSGSLSRDSGAVPSTSQTYTAAGDVNLRLRITNAAGETAIATAKLTVLAPTAARIRRLLAQQLVLPPQASRRSSLLRRGGYALAFPAPTAGRLQIRWYLRGRAGRRPVLLAAGGRVFSAPGIATVSVRLTAAARTLLRRPHSVRIMAKAIFTPSGRRPIVVVQTFTLTR